MIKNIIALVIVTIFVHLCYVGYIRPEANALMQLALASGQTSTRDIVVILKDYEQEICLILMLWGTFLIIDSYREILKTRYLFSVDFIHLIHDAEQEQATTADATVTKDNNELNIDKIIENLDTQVPQECQLSPLIRILRSSLWRYAATHNVQNLSDAIESHLAALAIRQDSENTMIRYLIWAIPSIGFIGTVRGIGMALSQADQALAGDIAGMTDSLGVAFNSTLVALLISIFLMFLFHQLQRLQDSQILDTQAYCEKYLLNRIR